MGKIKSNTAAQYLETFNTDQYSARTKANQKTELIPSVECYSNTDCLNNAEHFTPEERVEYDKPHFGFKGELKDVRAETGGYIDSFGLVDYVAPEEDSSKIISYGTSEDRQKMFFAQYPGLEDFVNFANKSLYGHTKEKAGMTKDELLKNVLGKYRELGLDKSIGPFQMHSDDTRKAFSGLKDVTTPIKLSEQEKPSSIEPKQEQEINATWNVPYTNLNAKSNAHEDIRTPKIDRILEGNYPKGAVIPLPLDENGEPYKLIRGQEPEDKSLKPIDGLHIGIVDEETGRLGGINAYKDDKNKTIYTMPMSGDEKDNLIPFSSGVYSPFTNFSVDSKLASEEGEYMALNGDVYVHRSSTTDYPKDLNYGTISNKTQLGNVVKELYKKSGFNEHPDKMPNGLVTLEADRNLFMKKATLGGNNKPETPTPISEPVQEPIKEPERSRKYKQSPKVKSAKRKQVIPPIEEPITPEPLPEVERPKKQSTPTPQIKQPIYPNPNAKSGELISDEGVLGYNNVNKYNRLMKPKLDKQYNDYIMSANISDGNMKVDTDKLNYLEGNRNQVKGSMDKLRQMKAKYNADHRYEQIKPTVRNNIDNLKQIKRGNIQLSKLQGKPDPYLKVPTEPKISRDEVIKNNPDYVENLKQSRKRLNDIVGSRKQQIDYRSIQKNQIISARDNLKSFVQNNRPAPSARDIQINQIKTARDNLQNYVQTHTKPETPKIDYRSVQKNQIVSARDNIKNLTQRYIDRNNQHNYRQIVKAKKNLDSFISSRPIEKSIGKYASKASSLGNKLGKIFKKI